MHHSVERPRGSMKLPLERSPVGLQIHRLREVSLGDGSDDARGIYSKQTQEYPRINGE